MKPGLCLFPSAGLWTGPGSTRRAAGLAAALLVASQWAGLAGWRHGPDFAHGPHRALAGLIGTLGPGRVAVVHDDPAGLATSLRPHPPRVRPGAGAIPAR